MSEDKFFYSKSGFAPYADGSGFRVTVTIAQDTEQSDPMIAIEQVYGMPASDWIEVARRIERLLDLVRRPAAAGNPQEIASE